MPGAAGAQPAGYQADLRGPGCRVEDEARLALLRAQGCAAAHGGGARGSQGVSLGLMQHPGRGGSGRTARGQGQGRQEGAQGRAPQSTYFGARCRAMGAPGGRPAQGESHVLCQGRGPSGTTSQDTGDPKGHPAWERAPPSGQECEQQGQRGDPCSSRPHGVSSLRQQAGQTASGSGKDSTIDQGEGAAPSLPGHLPERGARGRGHGEVRGRPGPFNALSYASHPGSSRKQEG